VDGVSAVSRLSHQGMTITRRPASLTPRVAYKLCGLLPSDTLGLFNGNVDTLACALLERMYYCKVEGQFVAPPPVQRQVVRDRLNGLRQEIIRKVGIFAPVEVDEFVNMYKGPKRRTYEMAAESILLKPVDVHDAKAKAFVKREKCNVTKAPRVIQPRDPRYGVALGRYIKPVEKVIYRAIASLIDGDMVVSKGLNLDGVGKLVESKWNKFRNPVAVGLDATKFDMHCSAEILEWEHSVYNGIFNSRELRKLLSWQINNRGVGYAPDGKVKYSVRGRRFSGDMNTSLGNCLIMCCVVIQYCRSLGIKYDLINNGDDCVVFMEQESLNAFSLHLEQHFIELGYRIVCEEPVYVLEHIEFCQMHPVKVNGSYRMVRNPKVAIEKDGFCVTTLQHQHKFGEWAAGVANGGKVGCAGVPVMQSFYHFLGGSYESKTHLKEDSGMSRLQRGMDGSNTVVIEETRYSYYLAFGTMPDAQVELEDWFTTNTWNDEVIRDRYPGYLQL